MKQHVIDATGRKLGRVATEAALLLRGKDTPTYAPNVIPDSAVRVKHASKIPLDEKKRKGKTYVRYSGYPGGQKIETLEKVIARKGSREVLRRAVLRMLPKNKLRARMMKKLVIEE